MTDAKPLAGIRILEVAAWTFVPAAGAVLAEWGADVIKVEPREGGDPQRGLVTMGLIPGGPTAVNYMIEMPNRGKKSIGIDLLKPGGQEVVHELVRRTRAAGLEHQPAVAGGRIAGERICGVELLKEIESDHLVPQVRVIG